MSQWMGSTLKARFLVASLGEGASPPFWRSDATSAVGQRMLARLFPRTYLLASLETASRAARREHDARIGRIGVYHLFRLPSAYEVSLHEYALDPATKSLFEELATFESSQAKLDALQMLAGRETASLATGPVRCGAIDELREDGALERICATYLTAFRADTPVFPYLEEVAS